MDSNLEFSPGSGSVDPVEVLEESYYYQTLHDFARYVKVKGIDKMLEDIKQLGYKDE